MARPLHLPAAIRNTNGRRISFGRSSSRFLSLLSPSPCAGSDRVCVLPGPPARPRPPCSWLWLCAWRRFRRLDCNRLDRVDAHRLRRNHLDRFGDSLDRGCASPAGRRSASLAAQTLCSSQMPIAAPWNWARPWDRLKEDSTSLDIAPASSRASPRCRRRDFESFAVVQTRSSNPDVTDLPDRQLRALADRWRPEQPLPVRQPLQGRMQPFKQSGQIGPRHRVVRDERHHDLGRQFYRV